MKDLILAAGVAAMAISARLQQNRNRAVTVPMPSFTRRQVKAKPKQWRKAQLSPRSGAARGLFHRGQAKPTL